MLRVGSVLRLRLPVTLGFGPSKTAATLRRVSTAPPRRLAAILQTISPLAAADSLTEVLDNWKKNREHGIAQSSDETLTRCLYDCLKVAQSQKMESTELMLDPQFHIFWEHLSSQVESMSGNTAVMCLYNCAKYNFSLDPSIAASLVEVCSSQLHSLPNTARCVLLWSLCKLDLYHNNNSLVAHVLELFHSDLLSNQHVKHQSFANVLWSLATTATWPSTITDSVIDYVCRRARKFDFHTLSIVLWSLTTANVTLPSQCLEVTSQRASTLLQSNFKIISLVQCCWAFGVAAHYNESFFSALTDRLLSEPIDSSFFTPRLLSSVAWSCARTGYYHPQLLDHIAQISLNKLQLFNGQDLSNLAYAYGFLNHCSDQLLVAISNRLSSQEELAANELTCASVVNACLIHRYYPEALIKLLMSPERISVLLKSGEGKHLHLLVQIHYIIRAERPDLKECLLQPPHDKVVPAMVVAESMLKCERIYSLFHHNIYKALLQITGGTRYQTSEALTLYGSFIDTEIILDSDGRAMTVPESWCKWGQPFELLSTAYPALQNPQFWKTISDSQCRERLDHDVIKEVCVASDWSERLGHTPSPVARRVAIEADGPRHYAVNCRHKLGNTEIKHRLLQSQGWDVVAIPFFEWEHLKTDQDHINYIASKIYTK